MSEQAQLKLFVWRRVFVDYTAGVAFALAETVEQAREHIARSRVTAEDCFSPKGCIPAEESYEYRMVMVELKEPPCSVYSVPHGEYREGGD